MEITNKTKLKDLFSEYPWLKEEIVSINDKFKLLHTPLAKVMLGKADIKMMSEKVGMPEDVLIQKLAGIIDSHK